MKDTNISLADTQAGAHTGAQEQKKQLNVLIACEESQAECAAFRALGHNAYSCDIQPCRKSGNPAWHIQGDVTPYLQGKTEFVTQAGVKESVPRWDLIIAHPPCTYLCRLSAPLIFTNTDWEISWRGKQKSVNFERFQYMKKGRRFFFQCLNADAPFVAVENPVPLAIAELPKPTCFADPSWFGVKYTKKTLYWLKNLPPIMPEIFYPGAKSYHNASRGKYRSRTFPQLAAAIAKQWSNYILGEIENR